MRWYFRKPAFEENLADYSKILLEFPQAEEVQQGEIAVNIYTIEEAQSILRYLERTLQQGFRT